MQMVAEGGYRDVEDLLAERTKGVEHFRVEEAASSLVAGARCLSRASFCRRLGRHADAVAELLARERRLAAGRCVIELERLEFVVRGGAIARSL